MNTLVSKTSRIESLNSTKKFQVRWNRAKREGHESHEGHEGHVCEMCKPGAPFEWDRYQSDNEGREGEDDNRVNVEAKYQNQFEKNFNEDRETEDDNRANVELEYYNPFEKDFNDSALNIQQGFVGKKNNWEKELEDVGSFHRKNEPMSSNNDKNDMSSSDNNEGMDNFAPNPLVLIRTKTPVTGGGDEQTPVTGGSGGGDTVPQNVKAAEPTEYQKFEMWLWDTFLIELEKIDDEFVEFEYWRRWVKELKRHK